VTTAPPTPPPADELPPDEGLLREYWHVLARRRRLIGAVLAAVMVLAALRAFLTRPVYQGLAKVLIERENPKVLTFKEVAEVDSARDDYYQTQYKLLQSRSLARRVIEAQGLLSDPEFGGPRPPEAVAALLAAQPGQSAELEAAVDGLLERLAIRPEKNSRLVDVAFSSHSPERAAGIANALARLYIEQTLEFRYQTSFEAARWLEGQIGEQRRKVEEAERALQDLKQQEGIVNIEERRALLEQKLKDLGASANRLKTERLEKEVLFRQMRSSGSAEDLPEVLRSPVVQALRIELAALGRREAQLAERYLDQHPEVLEVRKQIEETRSRLKGEAERIVLAAENDYKTAASQEASVLGAVESTKAEALHLAGRSIQYDSKMRELEAAKAVLDSLLARAKETDVAQELRASNIRIVDPAVVPRHPSRPRPRRDLVLALLFGLGLSVGLAFLMDHLDNTIKTPDDIRTHLRAPFLGLIPEAEHPGSLAALALLHGESHGAFVEGYRVLRTALSYSWPEQSPRVVVVTSALPGEGKTLTSVNLGLTLASSEAKVVVVDCDLRRSGIHLAFEVSRTPGLSDILVGKVSAEEAVQTVPGTRLDVLPAGTPAPSPADLMSGSAMKRLLDGLRQRYTWLILDTPPVAAVADPLVLASHADGVLMVAGAEMASRGTVREALQQVASTGARLLGVLLNRAHLERHRYYYGAYHRVRGQYQHARP
jgi:capsular exopolysaccharide synthesis family protein